MTYHYGSSTPSVQTQRTTINIQTDQEAPPGFHYMPDGTLMSDAEHERLYGNTVVGTGRVFDKKYINS